MELRGALLLVCDPKDRLGVHIEYIPPYLYNVDDLNKGYHTIYIGHSLLG